ncbi:phosphatase and actin regulator 2 [Aplochiton taeniatus]
MAEEVMDSYPELKEFPPVCPIARARSHSDTSGFRSRILFRLRGARSVDGLEKASLANCDVVVGTAGLTLNTPARQRGKLSSIGKLFKPWKWRKKKTSEKFQDLSKVLERKISTRQSREELIQKGVLILDQDEPINTETLNGHAMPSVTSEEVNVVVETPETPSEEGAVDIGTERYHAKPLPKGKQQAKPREVPTKKQPSSSAAPSSSKPAGGAAASAKRRDGPAAGIKKAAKSTGKQQQGAPVTAKTSHPKKTTGASKTTNPSSSSPRTKGGAATEKKTNTKSSSSSSSSPVPPKASPETDSLPGENSFLPPSDSRCGPATAPKPGKDLRPNPPAGTEPNPPSGTETKPVSDASSRGAEAGSPPGPHVNAATECTSFTKGEADHSSRVEGGDVERRQLGLSVNMEQAEVTVIPDRPRDSQVSDSDSDGPILYRDEPEEEEEEDEEDDEYTNSSLANKIRRRDTLNIKLGNRPSKRELEEKNILPRTSETQRLELRQQIGSKLVRRLSQRPSLEELEQRNILKQKNDTEAQEAKQEIKRRLSRKLSVRPTVAELVARRILRFNEYVECTDAKDYDRRADKPWTRLTPADKAAIRKELNEFKSREMEVHDESKQFTR